MVDDQGRAIDASAEILPVQMALEAASVEGEAGQLGAEEFEVHRALEGALGVVAGAPIGEVDAHVAAGHSLEVREALVAIQLEEVVDVGEGEAGGP